MTKKIMTLDNLYQFFIEQNKSFNFSSKESGTPIVVSPDPSVTLNRAEYAEVSVTKNVSANEIVVGETFSTIGSYIRVYAKIIIITFAELCLAFNIYRFKGHRMGSFLLRRLLSGRMFFSVSADERLFQYTLTFEK